MLPFILGGVALAVTGYGIGKLFEDDISKSSLDSYSLSDLVDVIDRFENIKYKLYETTLKELQTALFEIKNLEKDSEILVCESTDNQYDSLTLSDDIENQVDKYITLLEKAQNLISIQLDNLDELIMKSNDYEVYNDEEKEVVQKLIDLNNMIVNTINSKITLDDETIARDLLRAFIKIEVVFK